MAAPWPALRLAALDVLPAILAGCLAPGQPPAGPRDHAGEHRLWLVMVFVNADSGGDPHEWIITEDLEGLDASPHPESVHVVVQASRCGWDPYDGAWKGTRRYYVTGPAGRDPASFEAAVRLEDPPGPVDPSDGQSLSDFVAWASARYPADHRMLVIEAHGSGWRGLSPADMKEDPGDLMSIHDGELGEALGTSASLAPIDVVVLDACLMGMWETGFALRGGTRYALTSEEIGGPVLGSWPDVLARLGAGPDDPEKVCASIPGMLEAEQTRANSATRTCIDLSGHGDLTTAVDALASAALADESSLLVLDRALSGTLRFTKPAHADLGDLAARIAADPGAGAGMKAAARGVLDALDAYVVAHESSPFTDVAGSHGVCGPPGLRGACARSTGVAIWAPVPPPSPLWPVYLEGPWCRTRWDEALAALAALHAPSLE